MPAPPQILPPSPSASNAHRFDTYAALAAGGVVFALAVLLIWRMYKLSVSGVGPQDMTTHVPSYAGAAVDVAALPVFVVHADEVAGDDATAVECAVCLAEVRDGERGRLLPRCGHRFHVECIDRWFGTNSTCPVCRAVAVGQPDDVEACKGGGPAPVGVVEQS